MSWAVAFANASSPPPVPVALPPAPSPFSGFSIPNPLPFVDYVFFFSSQVIQEGWQREGKEEFSPPSEISLQNSALTGG